jgi:hypothetical protein
MVFIIASRHGLHHRLPPWSSSSPAAAHEQTTRSDALRLISRGCASQLSHFYLSPVIAVPGKVRGIALDYLETSVAAQHSIPQGELRASLANLTAVVGLLSPLMWSAVFALGVRRSTPSLVFWVGALARLVSLALSSMVQRAGPPHSTLEAEAKHG